MLPLMPTMATTATPDHTTDMAMAVDTMVDTTDTPTVMVATDISARGPLMPNPKLMPNPRPMPPLMPTTATTATPDTTVDTTDMVDTLAVITVMVDTTDTPTVMATDISARGPLMPNPNPRPMPTLMPCTMATTDTPTVDTMVDTTDTPTVMVDTMDMVDTGVKLVNFTPNHFFHPKP